MTDLHTLTGVYALDAVDVDDRRDFERHLQHCPACREEVAGLQLTAARLAAAAETPAPERMRTTVLAAISSTRQLPPSGRRLSPAARRWGGALLAAAATVAIGTLGTVAVVEHNRADHASVSQRQAAAVDRVLGAPDARMVTTHGSSGGELAMVVSTGRQQAVVTMTHMPALAGNRTYELWVIRSGQAPRPAGLTGGSGQVLVTGVAAADQIGVTVEPSGGSSAPTSAPIAVMTA